MIILLWIAGSTIAPIHSTHCRTSAVALVTEIPIHVLTIKLNQFQCNKIAIIKNYVFIT